MPKLFLIITVTVMDSCAITYISQNLGETHRARLFAAERHSVLAEAGVHHRVESISREGTAGADAQAGQRCLWQRAQHRLQGSTQEK